MRTHVTSTDTSVAWLTKDQQGADRQHVVAQQVDRYRRRLLPRRDSEEWISVRIKQRDRQADDDAPASIRTTAAR